MGVHRTRRLQAVPIGDTTTMDDRQDELDVRITACSEYQEKCKSLLNALSDCVEVGVTLGATSKVPKVDHGVNSEFTEGLMSFSAECEEKLHDHLTETKLSDQNSGWIVEPGEVCRRMAACKLGEELEARVRSTMKVGSGDANGDDFESISEATCGKLMDHLIFEVGERAQYVHRIILKKFSVPSSMCLRSA